MIIVDPAIDPYFIKTEKSQYNVFKNHKPKPPAKEYEKFVSSHTDIDGALKKIVDLKIEAKGGAVSLIEYLKEIRSLKMEVRRITHDDLDARLAHLQKQINEQKTRIDNLPKNQRIELID